ncbi:MAG: nucleotidyltransferase family protein [Chloroflexi bacterium]|nr:nucleotidyltransferase family protein [Chloroflexota bacterium]
MLLAVGSRTRSQLEERLCHLLKEPLDWPYVLREAQDQGIAPLLDEAIDSHHLDDLVPTSCRLHLGKARSWVLHRNLLLLSELKRVLGHFSTLGIEAIPIKGPILAETLYGDLSLRPVSDLDILVKPGALPVCRGALASLGYRSIKAREEGHPFHDPPYYLPGSPPLLIELHWALSDEALVPLDPKAIWERAGYASVDGARMLTLSPEDNLLFLAYHLTKHANGALRWLSDVARLLERHETSLSWPYIVQALPSTGTKNFLYSSLARAHRLLGAPVPLPILESIAPRGARRLGLNLIAGDRVFLGIEKALRVERLGLAHCLMHAGARRVGHAYFEHLLGGGKRPGWPRLFRRGTIGVVRSGLALLTALGETCGRKLMGKQRRNDSA